MVIIDKILSFFSRCLTSGFASLSIPMNRFCNPTFLGIGTIALFLLLVIPGPSPVMANGTLTPNDLTKWKEAWQAWNSLVEAQEGYTDKLIDEGPEAIQDLNDLESCQEQPKYKQMMDLVAKGFTALGNLIDLVGKKASMDPADYRVSTER